MQRKALKQLGKVTQWTSEKVFSGEKTQLSSDFLEFEKEIEVRRLGIERLHATSIPFYHQLTKAKPTNDPFPPPGSGKDKISYTEALGLVMIDYGDELGDSYGNALSKYGRARCKLAGVQEEFAARVGDNYIPGMESALANVNEYKSSRKKLDSRRLALDAAITKAQTSKKDPAGLEEEVNIAKQRFEEVEEETHARMVVLQESEAQQLEELLDLLEAELEYHTQCRDILDELRKSWTTGSSRPVTTRARSNTATSSRSLGRTAITRSHSSRQNINPSSDEETGFTPNRTRSQSNASSVGKTKEKKSMLPSFGLGKKSGLSNVAPKKKGYGKDKYSESRTALHSDEDEEEELPTPNNYTSGRARSQSQVTAPPTMRRAFTSPTVPNTRYADPNGQYVKVLYDYPGDAADELELRVGQVVQVKTEVSNDWWIGECDGRSGLFPKAYTEEYVPSPQVAIPPPMPARPRALPPPVGQTRAMPPVVAPVTTNHLPPSPNMGYQDSELDSEAESHGFEDADNYFTASLAAAPQPTANTRERPPTKKPAPPPPPSRRAASSGNLVSLASGSGSAISSNGGSPYLSPPPPVFGRTRSATTTTVRQSSFENSPFAGSEDDEADGVHSDLDSSPPLGQSGLSHGLGGLRLGNGGGMSMGTCGICGCQDFTQNVFKSKGTCSTCFHAH
ncbi:hypothetical protein IAR55_002833 [Kwoniella newhampshirensis]|uniref:BAR-domain-containing protein n=1 Tax=Kwoniella newhampshirensis TaxID=1651941 RepID=A0AAW0YZZ1_9TREE